MHAMQRDFLQRDQRALRARLFDAPVQRSVLSLILAARLRTDYKKQRRLHRTFPGEARERVARNRQRQRAEAHFPARRNLLRRPARHDCARFVRPLRNKELRHRLGAVLQLRRRAALQCVAAPRALHGGRL